MVLRTCLYRLAGCVPAVLLTIGTWVWFGVVAADIVSSRHTDEIPNCVLLLILALVTTAGCIGMFRAVEAPWTTTRRNIVKTLLYLSGALIGTVFFTYLLIDAAQREGWVWARIRPEGPSQWLGDLCIALPLLYVVEASCVLVWRALRPDTRTALP